MLKNLVGEKRLKKLIKVAPTKSMTEPVQTFKDYRDGDNLFYEPKKLRTSSIEENVTWELCHFLCSKPIVGHQDRFYQV